MSPTGSTSIKKITQATLTVFALVSLASCAPKKSELVVLGAESIDIDLGGIESMSVGEYFVEVKTPSSTFSNHTDLLNLTDSIRAEPQASNRYHVILPKNVTGAALPMLVTVNAPQIDTQFIDIIYTAGQAARPDLASTLAYELIRGYYPARSLSDYSASEFNGIKSLISARIETLLAESENLSLATTPFRRLSRYFKNGLAFNVDFLNAVSAYGVNYGFSTASADISGGIPSSHLASQYDYATSFTVGGSAVSNPFGHQNTPPKLVAGAVLPVPASNIPANEGTSGIHVRVRMSDADDDFMDKNFVVEYTPRVLPAPGGTPYPLPEKVATSEVITDLTDSGTTDSYDLNSIGYDEAYDLSLAIGGTDTAYRDVYYLVTDGMVRVPVHWNFKYFNINRAPVLITNASGGINNDSYDSILPLIEPAGPTWRQHGSHCETRTFDQVTAANIANGASDPIESIQYRSDGPWACAFKVYDPDLDVDPNGSIDQILFAVEENTNAFTEIVFTLLNPGAGTTSDTDVWPAAPVRTAGYTEETCVDQNGVTRRKCAVGVYRVIVDNAVKVAAETQSDSMFTYGVQVYDRAVGGASVTHSVEREVRIQPNPPRLLSYASETNGTGIALNDLINANTEYSRDQIYLDELRLKVNQQAGLSGADPYVPYATIGLTSNLTSTLTREKFLAANAADKQISEFVTQPRSVDPATYVMSFLGHSQTTADAATYWKPYEVDRTCSSAANNAGADDTVNPGTHPTPVPWSQEGGAWTFEIDIVDPDNIGLKWAEPSDPVYIEFLANNGISDISNEVNPDSLQYCSYDDPNTSATHYQTYDAVGALAAVDPDACTWTSIRPTQLQPIPVFYTYNAENQKVVYHRLRVRWVPKDQYTLMGAAQVQDYLINHLNIQTLSGENFQTKGSILDRSIVSDKPIKLVALRKDMKPCIPNATGQSQIVHQGNSSVTEFRFQVLDENKTLSEYTGVEVVPPVSGRYQADATLLGTRGIADPEFLKLLPFVKNCSQIDNPLGAGTVNLSEPALWYTQMSDGTHNPHIRLSSYTDPKATTGAIANRPFCLRLEYTPLSYGGNPYQEVVRIENVSSPAADITVTFSAGFAACAGHASVTLDQNTKYLLLPITVGGACAAHNVSDILWSDASSEATVVWSFDPADSGLAALTPLGNFDFFPSLYGASLTDPISATDMNTLLFDVSPVDTFKLNAGLPSYVGNSVYPAPSSTNLGPVLAAPASYTSSLTMLAVDWENDPQYINFAAATPAPDANSYYRFSPVDPTVIEVYVNPSATPFSVPLRASDVTGLSPTDLDLFDALAYTLSTPTPAPPVPAATPELIPTGRATCATLPPAPGVPYPTPAAAPAGTPYPVTYDRHYQNLLASYKTCGFKWNPNAGDAGKVFSYNISVQDNSNGNGARHPAGASSLVPLSSSANRITSPKVFRVNIEALEANTTPFAVDSGNSALSTDSLYNSGAAPGSSWWRSVFTGTAGIQPGPCTTSGLYGCALNIADNDALQSNTAVTLQEGTTQSFEVRVKDTNETAALRNTSATRPTHVLIADGAYAGKTYAVASFASMSIATTTVDAYTKTFSFSWTPTDKEANILSNPGGFLIPLRVEDQAYQPASGLPAAFSIAKTSTTIWIWAKLFVKNNTPQIVYVDNGIEKPLSGGILTYQTGSTTSYTVRIKDTDAARYTGGSLIDGAGDHPFAVAATVVPAPGFMAALAQNPVSYVAPYIQQEFSLAATPAIADVDDYTMTVTLTDPGDPSLGLALNDNSIAGRAEISAGTGNTIPISFTVRVIGKPEFLVPSATDKLAYSYVNKNFTYPVSLSLSRPEDKTGTFYVGLDPTALGSTSALTIQAKTASQDGIYMTDGNLLKWNNFNSFSYIGDHTVPIYAVNSIYCKTPAQLPSGHAIEIHRVVEATGLMDTPCRLTAADVTNNMNTQTLTIRTVNALPASIPVMNTSQLTRTYTPSPAPATNPEKVAEVAAQFREFKIRCGVKCNGAPTTSNAAPSGSSLTIAAGNDGYARYLDSDSFYNNFEFSTSGAFDIQKIYQDPVAGSSPGRTTVSTAIEGETLTFAATVNPGPASAPYPHYRWYVNGCLRKAGTITSATVPSLELLASSTMAGINRSCNGQYSITENNSQDLGKLIVRLSISNANEAFSSTTDSATKGYIWNTTIVNQTPTIMTESPAAPIVLSGSNYTGNADSQFMMPFTFETKPFIAYTDLTSSGAGTGLKVRIRELGTQGELNGSGKAINLNCSGSFSSQPNHLGVHPVLISGTEKLMIAASAVTNYAPPNASLIYGSSSKNCLGMNITNGTATSSISSTTDIIGHTFFSKHTISTEANAWYTPYANPYSSGLMDNFYFINQQRGSRYFWNKNATGIPDAYNPVRTEIDSNSVVRRTIVSKTNNKLFHLVGSGTAASRGRILISTLGTSADAVSLSSVTSIMFSDGVGSNPAPGANDCTFNGTPLDGVYVSGVDTFYFIANSDGVGKIGAISDISGTPTCSAIADVSNPSTNSSTFNGNVNKLALDPISGVIFGVITQDGASSSQLFSLDAYSQKVVIREVASSLSAHQVIYSPQNKAIYLYDNRRTGSVYPTLYRIW